MSEFKEFGKIARLNRDIVITEKLDGTNSQILIEPIELETPDTIDADGNVVMGQAGRGGNVPVGDEVAVVRVGDLAFGVSAGSRNRWLQPGKTSDNYGFAAWVAANAEALVALLGPGRHFGEWWGGGIQRKYGLGAKRFSLFNVSRYGEQTAYLDPRCAPEQPNVYDVMMTDEKSPEAQHKFNKGVKVCQCRDARAAINVKIGGVLIQPVPVLYRGPWFVPKDSEQPRPTGVGTWGLYYGGLWAPSAALDTLKVHGSQAVPFMDPEGIVVFHEASGQLFKATLTGDEKPKGAQ
jgi:hypothetical protein